MQIFTIGFTKKSAKSFFEKLHAAGVKRVVDIRLNNVSQLAGFAKRDDLVYFLREICNIDYVHMPELAPTKEILDNFKKNKGNWSTYKKEFRDLLSERQIAEKVRGTISTGDCLLCSEHDPNECHRRLVAEYLQDNWGDLIVQHLM